MSAIPKFEKKVSHNLGSIKLNAIKRNSISNQLLNKLIHTSGHDLRSPLFVIKSYAQLLQRTQDVNRLKRGFELIEDATLTMESLIRSLVELIDIYTVPTPLKELNLFQDNFELTKYKLYNEIKCSNPAFVINFDACPEVQFPSTYLKEIMNQLIDNAIRHNAEVENLQIHVRSFMHNNKAVLEVRDNGIGIVNEKEKEKILQPFYSTVQDNKRIGNGLSIIQGIAHVSHGTFEIKSELGQGMCCRFYF